LIQVYRKDWQESARLGADLTLFVFHEYLRAIDKFDDEYVLSRELTISEKDYRRTFRALPDCVSGEQKPASISVNLPIGTAYEAAVVTVNGYTIGGSSIFRSARTAPLCTARAYRFDIVVADYRKTVYLYGGDEITIMAPSDREYYKF
jgi:hypothetical protein